MTNSPILYYKQFTLSLRSISKTIEPIFDDLPAGGRFYCNISRAFRVEAYIPRIGKWSNPWSEGIMPGLEIPNYDTNFKLNFEEVSDLRSLEIKKMINETDQKFIVAYSGGIDSTCCLVGLLKNLSNKELKNIKIAMSIDSILENPYFFNNFIRDNFEIYDLMEYLYTDLNNLGFCCITADLGDFLFGTELGTKMYPEMKRLEKDLSSSIKEKYSNLYLNINSKDMHYSSYRDLLILYFNNNLSEGINNISNMTHLSKSFSFKNNNDKMFGELFYEKIDNNIKSSNAPVYSLHDFFWWTMINMRYIWGYLRPGFSYGENYDPRSKNIIDWFGGNEFQLWSLNNNNNGQKINGNKQSSYKWAARKYIYDFDKNDWYFRHKIKLPSMPNIYHRNWKKYFNIFDPQLGLDSDYNIIKMNQPGIDDYINTGLIDYKIDWI